MKYILILLFIVIGSGLYFLNQEQQTDNDVVDLDNLQGELIDPVVATLEQKSTFINSTHSNTTNKKNSSDEEVQKNNEDVLNKTKIVQVKELESQHEEPLINKNDENDNLKTVENIDKKEISVNIIDNTKITPESKITTTLENAENIAANKSDTLIESIPENKSAFEKDKQEFVISKTKNTAQEESVATKSKQEATSIIKEKSVEQESVVANEKQEIENTIKEKSVEQESVVANEKQEAEVVKSEENIETVANNETLKTLKKKPLKENKEEQEEYKPMSFQFLSSFVIGEELSQETITNVPDYVRDLEGQKIGIAGFMVPTDMTETEISQFLLVNMNDNCCFGGTPKITEFIYAELKEDKSKYTNFPIAIIGTFTINTNLEEKILYRMEVEHVNSARDRIFWDIMKNAPKFPETQTEPYSYGSSFYQD